MADIKPERGYVLVQLLQKDPLHFGGSKIVVPDTGKEEPQFAQIKAIGKPGYTPSGQYLDEGDYEIGDYCYFGKWQGLQFVMDGKDHKLVKQQDIYAVVKLDAEELKSLTQ